MDTKNLVEQAKIRFSHNASKIYLTEKYQNKLVIASQNGLWKSDQNTISFLNSCTGKYIIMVDTFGNPVKVNRFELLKTLSENYYEIMNKWFEEYSELENKR
jgi:hypothetical protein